MDIWKIIYITESGYEDEVEICAVNKVMAWNVFEDIARDFDEKVVIADYVRVLDEEDKEE